MRARARVCVSVCMSTHTYGLCPRSVRPLLLPETRRREKGLISENAELSAMKIMKIKSPRGSTRRRARGCDVWARGTPIIPDSIKSVYMKAIARWRGCKGRPVGGGGSERGIRGPLLSRRDC